MFRKEQTLWVFKLFFCFVFLSCASVSHIFFDYGSYSLFSFLLYFQINYLYRIGCFGKQSHSIKTYVVGTLVVIIHIIFVMVMKLLIVVPAPFSCWTRKQDSALHLRSKSTVCSYKNQMESGKDSILLLNDVQSFVSGIETLYFTVHIAKIKT